MLINTYVDDGDEVLLLRPSYAMYRFYAEVAGASVREIPYRAQKLAFPLEELLDAIRPTTRAILIANPNNPTGTGTSRAGIERILEKANGAAVLIDEAYYEFCGVTALPLLNDYPNLFVSRTFSKVYGMAAMRLGCLFSQSGNVDFLHKAQSPYSVNTLATLAAHAAIQDKTYIEKYVTEVLAARELLYVGLEKLGIPYYESKANFVLFQAGEPRHSDPRRAAQPRRPGARPQLRNPRLRARHRRHARSDSPIPGRIGANLVSASSQMLVFDMDGVLVDVTESYRETIVLTVEHFTGKTISHESIQDYKNQGGWNNDWLLSQKICHDFGVDIRIRRPSSNTSTTCSSARASIHRERWLPRDGPARSLGERFEFGIFTGRTTEEAEITLNREGVRDRFLLVSANDVEREKPDPEGLLKIAAMRPSKKLLYVGDTVDDARCAKAADVPFIGIAAPTSPRRDELVDLLRLEGAIQVLGGHQ